MHGDTRPKTPQFPAIDELSRGALEDRDRTVFCTIGKLAGAAARLSSPPAPPELPPRARGAPKPRREPPAQPRRPARGALSSPPGRPRLPGAQADLSQPPSSREERDELRAALPTAGTRISPHFTHTHRHAHLPLPAPEPPPRAAGWSRDEGKGIAGSAPVLPPPPPPPALRRSDGELAPSQGVRPAGRGSEPPAGLDGANLDKGHSRLHVSPSSCHRPGARASARRRPAGRGRGCSPGAAAAPILPSLPPCRPLPSSPPP